MPTFSLYLIRHGVAEERGEEYPDDSKRPLTAQGISRLRKEAQALDELGITIDQIITSPLLRTRQTADVIAESLKGKPARVTSDAVARRTGAVMRISPSTPRREAWLSWATSRTSESWRRD
jgi:phosphohistidine phosphatase